MTFHEGFTRILNINSQNKSLFVSNYLSYPAALTSASDIYMGKYELTKTGPS